MFIFGGKVDENIDTRQQISTVEDCTVKRIGELPLILTPGTRGGCVTAHEKMYLCFRSEDKARGTKSVLTLDNHEGKAWKISSCQQTSKDSCGVLTFFDFVTVVYRQQALVRTKNLFRSLSSSFIC